jgi:hypothetical protein
LISVCLFLAEQAVLAAVLPKPSEPSVCLQADKEIVGNRGDRVIAV